MKAKSLKKIGICAVICAAMSMGGFTAAFAYDPPTVYGLAAQATLSGNTSSDQ